MPPDTIGLLVECRDEPGVLHRITEVILRHDANISYVAGGVLRDPHRHNIRGERISVDTIPLVGEEQLADAVRAVARLHRARVLVLAGALMGGEITLAVREIREAGILVVCTSMAGSLVD